MSSLIRKGWEPRLDFGQRKPSVLSQEEWFAWLSVSEALMASFRISKEEGPTRSEEKTGHKDCGWG